MPKHDDPAANWRRHVIKNLLPAENAPAPAMTELPRAEMMTIAAPPEIPSFMSLAERFDAAEILPPKARELLLRLRGPHAGTGR
jgi:hypothetical protein